MARARLARAGRGFGWRGVVAGSAVAVAVAAAAAAGNATASSAATACHKAVGPFSVNGTRVLGAGEKPFVSYGITVPGLQGPDWTGSVTLDRVKIAATATAWCANTVRLQLSEDNLLGPDGTGFDRAYMTAIEAEVSLAERYRLVVVQHAERQDLDLPVGLRSAAGPGCRVAGAGLVRAAERLSVCAGFWA